MRISNLYNCGCDECSTKAGQLNLALDDKFKGLLNTGETAFKRLHEKGSYNPKDLQTEKAYKDLIDQTFEAFNFAITDNDMPETMRTALQEDARLFGGLKTHAQLFEASKLLLDDKGNLKPFSQLSHEYDKLNVTYNKNYLEAEYEFAVGSSQMAAKWEEFSDNDRYELQYRTAGDGEVRPEHAVLNGITLSKSDPFWLYYTPLNGWRCRCMAIEVLKGKFPTSDSQKAIAAGEKATTQIGKDGKNHLEIFRFNPGSQKVVFPPAHPYTKVAGAKVVAKELKKNEFTPAKTIEEADSFIKDKFGVFYQKASFGEDFNLDAKNLINKKLDSLLSNYKNELKNIGHVRTENVFAQANKNYLQPNPKYFNDLKKLEKLQSEQGKIGWLSKMASPSSIIDHEFAHILTNPAIKDQKSTFFKELKTIRKDYVSEMKSLMQKGVNIVDSKDFISKYANTDFYEFSAEGFADALNNENHGQFSKRIKVLIDKHFSK